MADNNKVVTHSRFVNAASSTTEAPTTILNAEQAEQSLQELINSGAIKLQGSEGDISLSSNTAGGQYLGDMTETEIQLYKEAFAIKQKISELGDGATVEEVLNSKLADIIKETNNAGVDAMLKNDSSSLDSLQKEYAGKDLRSILLTNISEEEREDLHNICILEQRYEAIMSYVWFIVKSRLDVQGFKCGVRTGWRVYKFNSAWHDKFDSIYDSLLGQQGL